MFHANNFFILWNELAHCKNDSSYETSPHVAPAMTSNDAVDFLSQKASKEMSALEKWIIQVVWPDLAKFRHFGQIFKVLGNFRGFIYYLGKSWTDFGKFCVPLNSLSICSHWIFKSTTLQQRRRRHVLKHFSWSKCNERRSVSLLLFKLSCWSSFPNHVAIKVLITFYFLSAFLQCYEKTWVIGPMTL